MAKGERWVQERDQQAQYQWGVKARQYRQRERWLRRFVWVAFVLVAMAMASMALQQEDQLQQRERGHVGVEAAR